MEIKSAWKMHELVFYPKDEQLLPQNNKNKTPV